MAGMEESPGSPGTPPVTADDIARLRQEQARLQMEIAGLRADLRPDAQTGGDRHRARAMGTAVLVVLTALLFTVSVAGLWARRNALNTDQWVEDVGPIAEEEAVQVALGRWVTDELMAIVDPESFIEDALPDGGEALAAPLAGVLRNFVETEVDAFLASETFHELWVDVNRRAHQQVVALLEGDPPPELEIKGDEVVFNVIPLINEVLAALGEKSPEIFGRTIDIPTVTVDDIPEEAIEKLEDVLGRDLPDDFGQFTVFDADRYRHIHEAVSLFELLLEVAVVVTVVLVAVTLWMSPHVRRTLLQLLVGIAVGAVVLRRLGLLVQDDVVSLVPTENQEAVDVVLGAFVGSLGNATGWVLAVAAVVAVVALVTGPYPWARALRRQTVSAGHASVDAVEAAVAHRPDQPAVAWVRAHAEPLYAGVALVGIAVLLLVHVTWLHLLVVVLVVAALEAGVHLAARSGPEPPDRGEGPS